MKFISIFLFSFGALGMINLSYAQTLPTDHFRSTSILSSDWTNPVTWESSPDELTWTTATINPSSDAASVTILPDHIVRLNAAGIMLTNTTVYGTLEVTTNANYQITGSDAFELIIENGGHFSVQNTALPSGSTKGLIKSGGKISVHPGVHNASFVQNYISETNGLFTFENASVCEWHLPQYPPSNESSHPGVGILFRTTSPIDLLLFRIYNLPADQGYGNNHNATVVHAILDLQTSLPFNVRSNTQNVQITGGIRGNGSLEHLAGTASGNIILGNTEIVPELSGNILLNMKSARLKFPNGANILPGATIRIKSITDEENFSIDREAGIINVQGTLDITNMRITNSSVGGIIVKNGGQIRTSHTGGLFGGGSAIVDYTASKLVLEENSSVEFYAIENQSISSGLEYYHLIFSGSGTKAPQNAIAVHTNGSVKISENPTLDFTDNNLGSTGLNNTSFTMEGGRLIIGTGGVQPRMAGTYLISGGEIEFTGNSVQNVRVGSSPILYKNILISGTQVSAGSTENAGISFQPDGTFTVMDDAVFKVNNPEGFYVNANSAIRLTNSPQLILNEFSNINYNGIDQIITHAPSDGYGNLIISGTGTKTIGTNDILEIRNDLTLNSGNLIIESGKSIRVGNRILNDTNAENFIVETDANLLQINDVAVNLGEIKLERFIHNMNNQLPDQMDYVFWSSPVSAQILRGEDGFSPGTPNNRFYQYNESNNYFISTPDLEFQPGKGYAIRAESGTPESNTNPYQKTYSFSGIPFNGIHDEIILQKTDDLHGFNLVGNPYPSNLDAHKFIDQNFHAIENNLYFWTNNQPEQYQQGSSYSGYNYAIYNRNTGGIAAQFNVGDPTDMTEIPTRFIRPGQGFIVRAKENNQSLVFNNSMRDAENAYFFQKRTEEIDRFWLTLTSPTQTTTMLLIAYVKGATNEFDLEFDVEAPDSSDGIYSLIGMGKLAIQAREYSFSKTDEVEIGIKSFQSGIHIIRLHKKEGRFTESQNVYLKDKYINKIHNLSENPYRFWSDEGEFHDRFIIQYENNSAYASSAQKTTNPIQMVYHQNELRIHSLEEAILEVEIFNPSGQSIYKNSELNTSKFSEKLNFGNQKWIVVRVKTESGNVTNQKILIHE